MAGIADQPLGSFLNEVARATPAPGGGSSAACACAIAAALVEMAAGLDQERGGPVHHPPFEDIIKRARALGERALELAERELFSYEPVLEALRLPADEPRREATLEAALIEASGPPLAIAEASAELAELGLVLARGSSPSVRGDALTGALLAEAAAAAAAALVEINLADRGATPLVERARDARARASTAREAAEALAEAGGA